MWSLLVLPVFSGIFLPQSTHMQVGVRLIEDVGVNVKVLTSTFIICQFIFLYKTRCVNVLCQRSFLSDTGSCMFDHPLFIHVFTPWRSTHIPRNTR